MRARNLVVPLLMAASLAEAMETASFLNVGAGGRALGMGGAYTALADDANAVYWNPAGLSALTTREVSASHAELTDSIRHDFLAYAQPTSVGAFGAAVTYLSQSRLNGRDAAGHPTADFTAADAAGTVAFARKTGLLDLGASVKFVQSHIASAQAQTFAADLGARKSFGTFEVGAALRNLGPGMKFDSETDDLPLRLAVGTARRFSGGHALTAEWTTAPRAGGNDAGFGGEYQAIKGVFLRAGYTTQTSVAGGSGFDAARGLTLGMGLRQGPLAVDYAAVPTGELGSTHRFTLGWRF